MPRTARIAPGGMVFHVLNRGVGRMRLFGKDRDFEAFEEIIEKTLETCPMRICSYLIMPNHWHFVLWPEKDGQLAAFMQKLSVTHVRNWQENRRRVGMGHVYQGRYKSFPIETEDYFYQVVRYVERNALRANLCERAEDWRWCSLWRRNHASRFESDLLAAWPMDRPRHWGAHVNKAQSEQELEAIRHSLQRGRPYGSEPWVSQSAARLQLSHTLRPRGRPRKETN